MGFRIHSTPLSILAPEQMQAPAPGRIALRREPAAPDGMESGTNTHGAGSAKDISVYPKVKRYYALSWAISTLTINEESIRPASSSPAISNR